ncbi:hypothetical protein Tco_0103472 [Tanacetum coccineum]
MVSNIFVAGNFGRFCFIGVRYPRPSSWWFGDLCLSGFDSNCVLSHIAYKMAKENVPDPTRTNEQLDDKTGVYSFQLDELWFNLNAELLCNALEITPKDSTHPFVPPPAGDLIIDFVKGLDYSGDLQYVFTMHYYKKFLEMTAHKPRQPTTMTDEEGRKKKKAPEAGKSKQPAPTKQPKTAEKKTSKPTPSKKIRKGKRSDHLVDEKDEQSQRATEPQVEDDEYNLQRGIQMSLESLQASIEGVVVHEPDPGFIQKLPEVEGKGKGIVSDEQAAQSLLDLQKPKKQSIKEDTSTNVVHDSSSPVDFTNDAENVAAMEQSNNEVDTEILNVEEVQGQARSDTGKTPESRPSPEREFMEEDQAGSNPGQSHVAQAGPNPEPMYKDFIAIVYPVVHESLKLRTEE